ncbi:hypothetical protein MMC13_005174 [Lambiella insularis]|nr:hypothetical protein [Lambiella insularis]
MFNLTIAFALVFVEELCELKAIHKIDYAILNAGILEYPNKATEMSFSRFEAHLRTNAVGPIIVAQRLLQTTIPIGTIMFMSSDSGSATNFRAFEDGFAAYAASKAALNQALRRYGGQHLDRMGSGGDFDDFRVGIGNATGDSNKNNRTKWNIPGSAPIRIGTPDIVEYNTA